MTRPSNWKPFGELHTGHLPREWRFEPTLESDQIFDVSMTPLEGVSLLQVPGIIAARFEQVLRLAALEERLEELSTRVERLEMERAAAAAVTLSIETFAPEPYRVLRPLKITVRQDGESFVASFFEANINSSGDNRQEAYANVKGLILDTFDRLSNLPVAKLGPEPRRQLAVLREFMIYVAPDNQARSQEDRQETESEGGERSHGS